MTYLKCAFLFGLFTLVSSCAFIYDSELLNNTSPIVKQILTNKLCHKCQLANIDLSDLDLRGVDLSGSNLINANFENSNLSGANLSYTVLKNANMNNAKLFSINLRGSDLRGVNLIDVRLAGADLRDTNMTDIDSDDQLDLMELTGVRLEGARFKDNIVCGSYPPKGGWGCVIRP